MAPKMLCSISDEPQTPDDVAEFELEDEDEAYERHRQENIDDAAARSRAHQRQREALK
jgi:hypothetical protein